MLEAFMAEVNESRPTEGHISVHAKTHGNISDSAKALNNCLVFLAGAGCNMVEP
jgi:hypothetical protein